MSDQMSYHYIHTSMAPSHFLAPAAAAAAAAPAALCCAFLSLSALDDW